MKVTKNLLIRKNLFIKFTNSSKNSCINLMPKISFFKNFLFICWFFNNFKVNNFFLIFNFISLNKFFFFNFSILNLLSFNLNNFFFFQKWQYFEPLLINKNLRFNLVHITNKYFLFNFNLHYLNNLLKIFINFYKISKLLPINNSITTSYLILIKSLENIFEKLTFIYFNTEIFLKNLRLINDLKKKFQVLFVDIFLKIKEFDKFYLSFQAFINNNLFLAWQTLFLTNISTASLNFLLLKNFNKFFFRIADKTKNYPLQNYLFWGRQNIFFAKGEPYYTFNQGVYKNSFIMNSNYYNFSRSKEFFFFKKKKSFTFFFEKNIFIKKFKFFNNKLLVNYLF